MESKIFSIGDIVTLKAHPFVSENTSIIVSGDHLSVPPLMVVIEISKSSYKVDKKKIDAFRYDCMWFSSKSYKFEVSEIYEDQLKLIQAGSKPLDINIATRGNKLNFKTVNLEVGKKKSTISYDENSSNSVINTTVNALLSFLPPILQFIGIETYSTKHPLTNKEEVIRLIPSSAVRIGYFNPIDNNISEYPLPFEVLEFIEQIPEKRLAEIQKIIEKSAHLKIGIGSKRTIIKPKSIAHRCGYYYLRGFDYVSNKVLEFELKSTTKLKDISNPILEEAPKFDILREPKSATSSFIFKEVTDLINKAIGQNAYIRIKYLNRNEQLTHRTVKNMQLVNVKEGKDDVIYMIASCLLRMEKRTFRVDRIQNVQLLNLNFRTT